DLRPRTGERGGDRPVGRRWAHRRAARAPARPRLQPSARARRACGAGAALRDDAGLGIRGEFVPAACRGAARGRAGNEGPARAGPAQDLEPGAVVTAAGAYSHRIFDSIAQVDATEWQRVRSACDASIATDPRFLAAVEASMKEGEQFWYIVVYDETGAPAA